jgi:hypothetical protein
MSQPPGDSRGEDDPSLPRAIEGLTAALIDSADSNRALATRLPSRTKARILEVTALVSALAALASLFTVIEIRSTQIENRRTAVATTQALAINTQILKLVEGAVGAPAVASNQAATAKLIAYLVCVIDTDTGHLPPPPVGCGTP